MILRVFEFKALVPDAIRDDGGLPDPILKGEDLYGVLLSTHCLQILGSTVPADGARRAGGCTPGTADAGGSLSLSGAFLRPAPSPWGRRSRPCPS